MRMDFKLQIVFLIISLTTIIYVINKIVKHKLNIEDSIVWIVWALILLVISIFPIIPEYFSGLFGFISTSNFIFCFFIFTLFLIVFFQSIEISNLKQKNKELVQKLSIERYKKNKK